MKIYKWLLIFAILTVFTVAFFKKSITIGEFSILSTAWMFGFFVYMVGPETISEITIGKASIKRDVQAAKEIREEIEGILESIKSQKDKLDVIAENANTAQTQMSQIETIANEAHTKAQEIESVLKEVKSKEKAREDKELRKRLKRMNYTGSPD